MEASPINRKEFLKRVQTDAFRRGFVTEETRTLWREVKQ